MPNIRDASLAGKPITGFFQSLPSPVVGETLGRLGADVIVADIQHGALTWDDLLQVIYGIEAGGAVPFVRVGWNDPMQIMRALDLGAQGVIVPMVSTPEEAALAVGAMRYGPRGNRSIGPVRQLAVGGYVADQAISAPFCMPMIETAEGLANIEKIAATPGVDGLFLGPGDLSLSLGLGLDLSTEHPEVLKAADTLVRVCERHRLLSGTVGFGEANVGRLFERGLQLIAIGSDRHLMGDGARGALTHVEDWSSRYIQGRAHRASQPPQHEPK